MLLTRWRQTCNRSPPAGSSREYQSDRTGDKGKAQKALPVGARGHRNTPKRLQNPDSRRSCRVGSDNQRGVIPQMGVLPGARTNPSGLPMRSLFVLIRAHEGAHMNIDPIRSEIEHMRRQILRQRKEIQDLQRAGIHTKPAEDLLERMLAKVDGLSAARDRQVGEQRRKYPGTNTVINGPIERRFR
jgi:hypothetical protein